MRKKPKAVCTVGLIIVNIAVFMVLSLLGDTENGYFMLHHGAMYEPMILENQEYYRFFTCMFLHFGIQHLLNNMVMLGALGWQLEPVIGKVKYLLIYFISGLAVSKRIIEAHKGTLSFESKKGPGTTFTVSLPI